MSQSTHAGESRRHAAKQKGASGPERARSIRSYLRQTRVLAFFAVAALVGGIVSDFTDSSFWADHSLLTSW